MGRIIDEINALMPINITSEEYEAIFGKTVYTENDPITESADYNCGAIANELEFLRGFIDFVIDSLNVNNASGVFLEKIIYFFTQLQKIFDEEDENLKIRFDSLILRNGNLSWMTGWCIKDVFGYYFDRETIYVINNFIETSLFVNGDLEQGSGDLFTSWNKTEAGSSVIINVVNAWWIQVSNPFGTDKIRGIESNGSALWVAVGENNKLATSIDGETWIQRVSSFTENIRCIAYNGLNLWVAASEWGELATSPDGINWIQRTSSFGSDDIYRVAHNQSNLWVAVGWGGKLATSSDGITWNQETSSFGSTNIYGIAYNGIDMWVAVGLSGKLATSSDGVNWNQETSSFGSTAIFSIAHNGSNLWVAVGASGKLATSPDGVNWTQRTSSFGSTTIEDVAYDLANTEWTIVGSSGKLATSTDGITWILGISSFGTDDIYNIASGLYTSVICGKLGKMATARRSLAFSGQRAAEFQIDSSNNNASLDQTVTGVVAGDYKIAFFYSDDDKCPDDNLIYLEVQRSGDNYYYNFDNNLFEVGATGKYFEKIGSKYQYGYVYLNNPDTRDLTFTIANAGDTGIAYNFRIDLIKFGIWQDYPSVKVFIKSVGVYGGFSSLWLGDEDNLMDRGACESTTSPMMADETVPFEPTPANQTWGREVADPYMGTYTWKLNKDVAAAAGDAETFLSDNKNTTDMHGLSVDQKYTFECRAMADEVGNEHKIVIYEYYSASWHATDILVAGAGAYERLNLTWTMNSGTTGFAISVFIESAAALNSNIHIDNIRIVEGIDQDIEFASFFGSDFIAGPGGGYVSTVYDELLDKIKPAGIKGEVEIISTI